MSASYTIGIEEEFQMVDRRTGQLSPCIHTILEKGRPLFGEKIKAEIQRIIVEFASDIFPDMSVARVETRDVRARLARLMEEEGLALLSAGTHPCASWKEEMGAGYERYAELAEEFRDLRRSTLFFGLHIHIGGIEDQEIALALMNQARSWLPHLLALSANSPFWAGRFTGFKSYRSVAWKSFPRSGVPELFPSWKDFDSYVQTMIKTGRIDNGKSIWWDIRPHPFLKTIEFRVFDMPATIEDTLAIAALCQALIAKLAWLYKRNMRTHVLARHFIEENKWHAMRDGLDAEVVDFVQERRLSMRESIGELLDFVDDMLDDLGSRREIDYLRRLLDDPHGTGADRQVAVYQQTGSVEAVVEFLVQETLKGIAPDSTRQSLVG
jgi:glutamate---cysteine ligase / carboxylate-amine ligase